MNQNSPTPPLSSIFSRGRATASLAFALVIVTIAPLRAADVTWNNMAGNFLWNTTDMNWSTGLWNNANGDGAIFGATGAGIINVSAPINVSSLNFTANGYTLNGSGPLNIVSGTSTLGTGFISVGSGLTAVINTGINSSVALQKVGAGTLQLGGPVNFSGNGIALGGTTNLLADLYVAGASGASSGKVTLLNSSVLPATTRVGIANGLLDIGSNNVTLSRLTFVNQADTAPFNLATGSAAAGVIGTGTLRVTGDINVIGQQLGTVGNSIGANLDLGGGTQIFRIAQDTGGSVTFAALQISGVISNGSILKSFGTTENNIQGTPDGMALYGNNTYAGSTILNGGQSIITGTNATTSVKVAGASGGGVLTLQGANGSLGSATTITAQTGATFSINNNGAVAGSNVPSIPAAQNNDRIRDDAEVRLLNGTFGYVGFAGAAATETFGNLNVLNGSNTVSLVPNGGGTAALTASGNLLMGPRATLLFSNSTTLGGTAKFFVNGTLPAADATGLLPRMFTTTDFVTYSPSTGVTPLAAGSYATDFSTAGTNVAVTAAATVPSSVNVNAIKSSGTFATTIAAGQTLGVTSGMILNTANTRTYTGGTIAFGAVPGVFAGSTMNVSSALTGTAGLINASSALSLSGDLSGLTGTITSNSANGTTLSTNTFAGSIEVRNGLFTISTSQTLPGQGGITIGIAQNDSNLIGTVPLVSVANAAVTTMGRDIIFDNGGVTAAGDNVRFNFLPQISPLSNTTGSQTLSGNITLNSTGMLRGGSPTTANTGSTNFTGNVSGAGQFYVVGSRANFSGNVSNAGGFHIGDSAVGTQVTFSGATTGSAPIFLEDNGNTLGVGTATGTQLLYNSGSLPTGPITFETPGGGAANIIPLQNSTINNSIVLNAPGVGNVGAGISANWNGQMSGSSTFQKTGTGTLSLGNANNTYTGATTVTAGTLLVQGANASSSTTVQNTGTLGGIGNMSGPVTVNSGGTIAPGNSIGTFATGSLTLSGTFLAEINANNGVTPSADLLNLTGTFSITGGVLMLSISNLPADPSTFAGETILLVANDGADAISGTFGSVSGVPGGFAATVDYAFSGTDSLGRIGSGNDLAVRVVPEPQTYALLLLGVSGMVALRRWRKS